MTYQTIYAYRRLWHTAPALILSLHLLLGTSFSLFGDIFFLFLGLILPLPFIALALHREFGPFLCCYIVLAIGATIGFIAAAPREEKPSQTQSCVLFFPKDLKVKSTPFDSYYEYKGRALLQDPSKQKYHYLPALIRHPKTCDRPLADASYFIHADIEKCSGRPLTLKTLGPWSKVESSFSLCELRYQIRQAFRKHLCLKIANKKVSRFLFSLCTGEIETQMLSKDFSQLGLGHILAISGFHFGIIATFFAKLTSKILPRRLSLVVLFIVMSLYFFFIGNSPSVLRAWMAISITIAAKLLQKKAEPLNILGVCLLAEVILDPENIGSAGFQLSFLCTFALLYIVPAVQNAVQTSEVSHQSFIDSLMVKTIAFIKKAVILNLCVHAASVLLCLYHFKTFPLLSLVYNLFFPSLTSLSLCLFLVAELVFFLPSLSDLLMQLNTIFTSQLLKMTEHPPLMLHYELSCSYLRKEIIILYLVGISWLCLLIPKSSPQINASTSRLSLAH